jgi:hypothetical protein
VIFRRPENFKTGGIDQAQINALGPIVKTHRRHFRQQSRYTVCGEFITKSGWYFAQHQDVFDRDVPKQDLTWKIIIPASERITVLAALTSMNINAFSLFDSEESLMEMLAVEHIDLLRANREARRKLSGSAPPVAAPAGSVPRGTTP